MVFIDLRNYNPPFPRLAEKPRQSAKMRPPFCRSARDFLIAPKRGIFADPIQNGPNSGVFQTLNRNICRIAAFLARYGFRPKAILTQRMASGRAIMRLVP
jgi:hypothetical protein